MVSNGNDEHDSPELEMSGSLEEFLMPSSPKNMDVRSSMDSFKDGSETSLEQSHNSSSWTSASCCSSCSCHLMSGLKQSSKSALVFHNRPILSPLICTTARTEMLIYKKKAVEKEKRRQQKEKQRLISRVEAILAGVESTPTEKSPISRRSTTPTDCSVAAESEYEKLNSVMEHGLVRKASPKESGANKELTTADSSRDYDVTLKHNNYDITNQCQVCDDAISTDSLEIVSSTKHAPSDAHHTSIDNNSSFHDNAYKSSLRNLLRKSLSFNGTKKTPPAPQPSSSESDDTTDNTVIDVRQDKQVPSPEDSFVNTIVETAIKAATDDIIKERTSHGSNGHCNVTHPVTDDEPELPSESVWGTPKLDTKEEPESPFCLLNPSSPPNLDQSTSTKVNAPQDGSNDPIAKSPLTVKPKVHQSPNLPLEGVIELSGSVYFESTVTDDLTMLRPTLSNTISDCIIDDTKENCDPTIDTGSLKNESLFMDGQFFNNTESAIAEAELLNQDAQGGSHIVGEDLISHKARVRRGSYTLDEPSPYLARNKDSLTIESWDLEESSVNNQDAVVRKLHLPSDSEESSLRASTVNDDRARSDAPSRAEVSVVNLCRILQDQHKSQMEAMKKRHHEQLEALQKELVHGEEMSLPKLVCAEEPRYSDVTIPPSLASTEYHDIKLTKKPIEVHLPEYSENSPPNHDVTIDSSNDVSRITDVQVTVTLHEKLCKFSALCKGHLTRQLLRSNKVQEIMQVIRDTSSLILSLRMELNESKGLDIVRDSYLEDRLYTQLRSAMLQFHEIFFETTVRERMLVVAQSCLLEKIVTKKVPRTRKLSVATQKSLERKRLMNSNSPQLQAHQAKAPPKEIKSKISHIWKSDTSKLQVKQPSTLNLPSKSVILKKSAPLKEKQRSPKSQSHSVTSQSKKANVNAHSTKHGPATKKSSNHQRSPMTSQRKNVTSSNKNSNDNHFAPLQNPPVISQSVPNHITSSKLSKSKLSMQSQRKFGIKKPAPLSNRANTVQRS